MMDFESKIERLGLDVYDKVGKPVNVNVVRAMLESMSIRAVDAKTDYGVDDLQELARMVFSQITSADFLAAHPSKLKVNDQFKSEVTSASDYLRIKTKYFFYYYPLGLFHGLPVFIQILTIILFGYSLWTYVGFNQLQSTAVVLGVIFGLVGTGGFVQVIGRQISHYWYNNDFVMARKSTIKVIKDGLLFMSVLSVLLLVVNFFANIYPYRFLYIVYIYSFSIGILLLISAVFHPLKQRWMITVAFVVATGLALSLKLFTNIDTYFTHWIGIWVAIILMVIYLNYFFNKKMKATRNVSRATSKSAVMIYRNYRYFFYGLLFFVFIFIDRILAWSTSADGLLPYAVYYEKNYEVGMDIAILIFFLLVGVLEFSIASFSTLSDLLQKQIPYNQPQVFNRKSLKTYWEHVQILLITGVVMIALLYTVIWVWFGYERAFNETLSPISIKVSILGGLGYILLAWGMLNSLYLFTLNKPTKPLKAIMVASVVNLVVGLFLSRLVSYEYSVVGMLVGSTTFMLLTLKSVTEFFKNLDYYYYAAY
ncbi:hypothetical protein [Roseivirga seohaensis]|uniref:hypothetical protein n=1 Tax=Roseivirga seohaensis TaxID=1914963 RepID=UPI003BAA6965